MRLYLIIYFIYLLLYITALTYVYLKINGDFSLWCVQFFYFILILYYFILTPLDSISINFFTNMFFLTAFSPLLLQHIFQEIQKQQPVLFQYFIILWLFCGYVDCVDWAGRVWSAVLYSPRPAHKYSGLMFLLISRRT